MTTWTRINDADAAVELLPAWFAARMLGTRGSYGFLLTTGDVVRVSRVTAIYLSSNGSILLDVLLDQAGVPEGVDMAWRTKHFLGVPVPAAPLATVNIAQVVMAFEFKAAQLVETGEFAESFALDALTIHKPRVADAVPPERLERVDE